MTLTAKDRRPTMQEVAPQLRSFWMMSAVAPSEEEMISSLSEVLLELSHATLRLIPIMNRRNRTGLRMA